MTFAGDSASVPVRRRGWYQVVWCVRLASRHVGRALAAEPEPAYDRAVAVVVVAHQVRKQSTPLSNELEETAPRVMILGKAVQMLVQARDPLRQECDLDLRRARVTLVQGVLGDDASLCFPRERHPGPPTIHFFY